MKLQDDTVGGAVFSTCGRYRYSLHRCWDTRKPAVVFCGLNPSTATADEDDPTIRRCINFARAWGFGELTMLNLFAWRSTDPRGLLEIDDPVGSDNDKPFGAVASQAWRVVLAWGSHQKLRSILPTRARAVRAILLYGRAELGHLGANRDGSPKHPLYLKADTAFQRIARSA